MQHFHRARSGPWPSAPTARQFVLTGSVDKTGAALRDAATARPLGAPLQHQGRVEAVAFSPDGKTVLTGSGDRTARLWDTATAKPFGAPLQHQGSVTGVAFSPDGKTVLTGSVDQTARLWDAATARPLGAPLQHQGVVEAVAFSPDGKTVLTASAEQTARLWDVPSPLEGNVEQIVLWVQLLAKMELDSNDASHVLDARASGTTDVRAWRSWESPRAGSIISPSQPLAWHQREAASSERAAGQWFAARWHLDRLIVQLTPGGWFTPTPVGALHALGNSAGGARPTVTLVKASSRAPTMMIR